MDIVDHRLAAELLDGSRVPVGKVVCVDDICPLDGLLEFVRQEAADVDVVERLHVVEDLISAAVLGGEGGVLGHVEEAQVVAGVVEGLRFLV